MENNILFLSGIVVSCLVITIVIFQFIDRRHKRIYDNEYLYLGAKIGVSIFLMVVNLFQQPMVNMLSWIIVFGLVSYLLYFDDIDKPIQRILEAEVMVLVFIICETVGIVLLEFIFWKVHMPSLNVNVRTFLNMTFSMLVLLFIYYALILRIWGKKEKVKFTRTQCILHTIIAIYSFINMIVIIEAVGRIKAEGESFILLINMGFIVFADMYFLYFIQFVEESNQLKVKFELLEQQATMQYHYYVQQEKKYRESISILHDVDKHIMAVERLYNGDNREAAINYTKEINRMLKPLIPQQLTNYPILNILLSDKIQNAEKASIDLHYEIDNVELNFMNPMDVTTIFGNLLDNAIEACEQVEDFRWIKLKISPYYEMIAIRIENSSRDKTHWKNSRPVSQKGLNHGIGLSNVERVLKKYDGSMHLSSDNGIFQCNIIINR